MFFYLNMLVFGMNLFYRQAVCLDYRYPIVVRHLQKHMLVIFQGFRLVKNSSLMGLESCQNCFHAR